MVQQSFHLSLLSQSVTQRKYQESFISKSTFFSVVKLSPMWGSGGTAPRNFKLGTGWMCAVNPTLVVLLPGEEPPVALG
jgi:hypothetical protein